MTKNIILLALSFASLETQAATTVFDFESQPLGPLTDFDQGDFRLTVSTSSLNVVFNDGNPGNAVGTNDGDEFLLTIETISGSPFEINNFDYWISSSQVDDAILRVDAVSFTEGIKTGPEFVSQTAGYISYQSLNATGGYTSLEFAFTTNGIEPIASIRVDNISVTSIPEPSFPLLVSVSILAIATLRRRTQSAG